MKIDLIKRAIREYIKPLGRKILLMIGRGKLGSTTDGGAIQLVSASFLAGEVKNDTEKIGHYGLAYHAPEGSDVVMVSVAGARDNGIIIATESRQYRLKNLGKGEVAIYSMNGDHVHLKNGNVIDIKTKTLNINADTAVNITSPNVNISASAKVTLTTPEVDASAKIKAGADIEGAANINAAVNLVAMGAVQAPAMAAATSLTVQGDELSGYSVHTHNYIDDTDNKVTDPPN